MMFHDPDPPGVFHQQDPAMSYQAVSHHNRSLAAVLLRQQIEDGYRAGRYAAPNEVYRASVSSADAFCGCPGCADSVKWDITLGIPPVLQGIYPDDAFFAFAAAINKSAAASVFAPCPFIFCHFVIPFSPACMQCYCNKHRGDLLRDAIAVENQKIQHLGLKWIRPTPTTAPLYGPNFFCILTSIPSVRAEYEACNPTARKLQLPAYPQPQPTVITVAPGSFQGTSMSAPFAGPSDATSVSQPPPPYSIAVSNPSFTSSGAGDQVFCTACGTGLPADSAFCSKCGKPTAKQ